MPFDLRNFLRKVPKPRRIRVRTAEDEEKTIELAGRRQWAMAEEAVRTAQAVSLELLDEKGNILRAPRLRDDEDIDAETEADAKQRYEDKLLTKDRRDQAAMLDRYGARLSEAFTAGAAAASSGQDKLVQLVEVLTENLTSAIVNVHNMSVNLATIIQTNAQTVAELQTALASAGVEGGGSSEAMKLLGTVLAARGVPMPGAVNGTANKPKPKG